MILLRRAVLSGKGGVVLVSCMTTSMLTAVQNNSLNPVHALLVYRVVPMYKSSIQPRNALKNKTNRYFLPIMFYCFFRDKVPERTCGCDEGHLHRDHAGIDGRLQVCVVFFSSCFWNGRPSRGGYGGICRMYILYMIRLSVRLVGLLIYYRRYCCSIFCVLGHLFEATWVYGRPRRQE